MDALSQALKQRRGGSIDPSMIYLSQGDNPSAQITQQKPQDVRKGFQAGDPADGNVGIGMPETMMHGAVEQGAGVPMNPAQPQSYMGQHTSVPNESGAAPQPAGQSAGTGGGDLGAEIRNHVTGHASQAEYDQLKGMKPRSLGERAKMSALKGKYSA